METKINVAVESFTNIAATNAAAMHETAEAAMLSARAAVPPHVVGNLPFGFQPPPEDGYNRAPIPTRLKLFAADPVTLASAHTWSKGYVR